MVSANMFRPICFGQLLWLVVFFLALGSVSTRGFAENPVRKKQPSSTEKKTTAAGSSALTSPALPPTAVKSIANTAKKSIGTCSSGSCGGKVCTPGSLQLPQANTAAMCTRCCVTCGSSKYCGCAVEAGCGSCCCGQCCTP